MDIEKSSAYKRIIFKRVSQENKQKSIELLNQIIELNKGDLHVVNLITNFASDLADNYDNKYDY